MAILQTIQTGLATLGATEITAGRGLAVAVTVALLVIAFSRLSAPGLR